MGKQLIAICLLGSVAAASQVPAARTSKHLNVIAAGDTAEGKNVKK